MKGPSSKRIALKADVLQDGNLLFAGASVCLSARKFYRLTGAVKGLTVTTERN